MKIGLLGGTFNPIHKGHLNLCEQVKNKLNLNEIWLIPSYITPDKANFNIERLTTKQRVKMLNAAIKATQWHWLKLSKIELKLKSISYTYKTIAELKRLYPENDFYFIIGDDRYLGFDDWEFSAEILKQVKLVVYNRTKCLEDNPQVNFERFIYLRGKISPISSTEILHQFKWEFVAPGAKEYIAKNYLYLKHLTFITLYAKRYNHSVSVASFAKRLAAKTFTVNQKTAYYAGLVHDLFKYRDYKWQEQYFRSYYGNSLFMPLSALHSYTLALWLEHEYGIKNKRFLAAVRNHTLADKKMSKLSKILYVADKIAIDRKGKTIVRFRRLAFFNLDLTFIEILKWNYNYIQIKNYQIPEPSAAAFKEYLSIDKVVKKPIKTEGNDYGYLTKNDQYGRQT